MSAIRMAQNAPAVNYSFQRDTAQIKPTHDRRAVLAELQRRQASESEEPQTVAPATSTEMTAERQISESADAINFILARANCPAEHRAFIDAVIGAADGHLDWFEANDFTIGKRIRGAEQEREGDTPKKLAARVTKTTQRERNAFNEWQAASGFVMIESKPGGKRGGVRYDTQYRVPLLAAAGNALRRAQQSSHWNRNRKRAMENAAKLTLPALQGVLQKRDEFKRPSQEDADVLTRNHKTILTNARKNLAIIKRNGGDPANYIEQLKQSLEYLKFEREGEPCEVDKSVQLKPVHTDTGGDSGQADNLPASGPEMNEATTQGGDAPARQAVEMLDAFESVGARSFDVTITDEQKQPQEFTARVDADSLRHRLPDLLARTERGRCNLIIRPRGDAAQLVQLDDLSPATVERLAGFAFLVVETSPANYQAWLAVDSKDSSIRQRLRAAIEFDAGANGAVRVAGSLNVKPERRTPDGSYHRVQLVEVELGLLVEPAELERNGLLAPQQPPCVVHPPVRRADAEERAELPDYDLSRAPASQSGKPDRSSYDMSWSMKALRRGCDPDDVVRGLRTYSPKARTRRDSYAEKTVCRAAQNLTH